MGLTKGIKNNPNGRKKGIPNKSTSELRNVLQALIEKNFLSLEQDMAALEPKERIAAISKFLTMILPPPITDLSKLSENDLNIIINTLKQEYDENAKNTGN